MNADKDADDVSQEVYVDNSSEQLLQDTPGTSTATELET